MSISKTTKGLLIIVIILNIICFFLYLFVSNKVEKNLEEISLLNRELDTQLLNEEQIKSFKNIINETILSREELDSRLVSSQGVVSFITEIENLAQLANISINIGSVSVSEYVESENKSETIEFLNFNINTEGSWTNSAYFLSLLENAPYRIIIDNLSFDTKEEASSGVLKWNGALSFKVLKIK